VDWSTSSLHVAYAKYLAYLDTQKALAKIVTDGKWVLAKPPTNENFIDIFISKSAFFKNYQPFFPHVQDYPILHLWLKNDKGVPSDMEAWGVQKNVYMFRDLEDYFVRMDKKKGKGGKACGSGTSLKQKSDKSKGKKKAT